MRYLLFSLLCCLSFVQPVFGQGQIVDKIIGVVGAEVILLSDVEEQFALMSAQSGPQEPEARCAVLDNLLAQKLLLNQAKLDSIVITEEEVETQLETRIERILAYMNGDLNQFEQYYGQSINEVKEQFREDLKGQILVERMQGQINSSVTVTPMEVKQFFAQIPVDSLPYFNSEVEIGEIVIKPEVNSEERKRSLIKLQDLRNQIVMEGADFAELATKHSDDPGSGRVGGDLGWQKRGTFVPEFEAAAFNLKPDEISEVIESEFGFHLIQQIERRGNSVHARHILIKPRITDADNEKAIAKLDSVRQLILNDSMSFSVAVKRFSTDKAQSFNNDGRIVNPQTGNTYFETSQLEPDVYFTIDTMNVGSISTPFATQIPGADAAFSIIQLQSRTSPHVASLKQDYSKIQTAALEQKRGIFLSGWVEEKVDGTFIKIDDRYNSCPTIDKWQK